MKMHEFASNTRAPYPRKALWSLLMCLVCALAAAPATAATKPVSVEAAGIDPFALYGERIEFDVLRNGERVGEHVTTFTAEDDALYVDHRFEIDIRIFVLSYSYRYTASATWREGAMETLTAQVDDDGDKSEVRAKRVEDMLQIDGPAGEVSAEMPIFPTHHWNSGVLDQARVFNTITGDVDDVTISVVDREVVETEIGAVVATRYAYSGDLETEVWYDDAGRWVKMAFTGTDGSSIEYICRRCQGTPRMKAASS